MKVLLLGGSGIISSEICSLALNRGIEVTMINRGQRKEKIDTRAKLIISDLKNDDIETITNKLDSDGYDVIVDFISYYRSQLSKMLAVANGRCQQYIFFSSATAYLPKEDNSPYVETDLIGNTGWQYAAEKAECEKLLKEQAKAIGVHYTIIRPYITYGDTRIPYQVAPLSYYTVINRIRNGKPIPIFGSNIQCTLTASSDFAVGAVGLFLNPKAYDEAYHIVGDSVTTWDEVISSIGQIIGIEPHVIKFGLDSLAEGNRKLGFDVNEILFDKGRSMIFDNSKIKQHVPDFCRFVGFYDGIKNSIDHFEEMPVLQRVDYAWDARVDRFIERFATGVDQKSISLDSYKNKMSSTDIGIYKSNRTDLRYFVEKVKKKMIK